MTSRASAACLPSPRQGAGAGTLATGRPPERGHGAGGSFLRRLAQHLADLPACSPKTGVSSESRAPELAAMPHGPAGLQPGAVDHLAIADLGEAAFDVLVDRRLVGAGGVLEHRAEVALDLAVGLVDRRADRLLCGLRHLPLVSPEGPLVLDGERDLDGHQTAPVRRRR